MGKRFSIVLTVVAAIWMLWFVLHIHHEPAGIHDHGFATGVAIAIAAALAVLAFHFVRLARRERGLRERSRLSLLQAHRMARLGDWEWDLKTNQQRWSEAAYEILGVQPGTAPSVEAFSNALHPDDRQRVADVIKNEIQRGHSGSVFYRVVHADNSVHHIASKFEAVRGAHGSGSLRIFGTVQDITDVKLAEQALAESEAAYRSIFELSAVGKAEVDRATGRFVLVNQRFCQLIGYSAAELRAMTVRQITHPGDIPPGDQVEDALARTAVDGFFEKRYITRDGKVIWVELSVKELNRGGAATAGAVIASVQDITERKRAQEAVYQTEQTLRLHNRALNALARERFAADNPDQLLKTITELAAKTLNVARCGVWLHLPERDALRCHAHYDLVTGQHSRPVETLPRRDFPAYFEAIEIGDLIPAHDAAHDARTREFAGSYLTTHGIGAMLDAPIRIGGKTVGVVCHEHVGSSRIWSQEEQNFADSVTAIIALALAGAERYRAEQALREVQAILAQAQKIARLGVWWYDVNTATERWSDEAYMLLGLKPGEIEPTMENFLAFVHPEDRERARHAAAVALSGGACEQELRVVRRDGHVRELKAHAEHLRDPDGKIFRVIGTVVDITELKVAMRTVRESERFAHSIVHALRQHIAILNESGVIIAVNQAWRDFAAANTSSGCAGASMCAGVDYLQVCDAAAAAGDEQAAAVAAGIRSVMSRQADEFVHEYSCQSLQQQLWFNMRVTRFAGDQPVRVVVAHEDVTQRRLAEALERERIGLKEAVVGMEQVLGIVGHELRTPLAGLRAISEFLLTDGAASSEQANGFLRAMNEEVVRMSETVNNLLEAARLNSGKARWNFRAFRVMDICRAAADTICPLVDPAQIKVNLSVVPEELTMSADPDAVRRLIVNLAANARRHTQAGHIDVSAAARSDETGDWVDLCISDTGSGIPPEILSRLGEAFALNSGVVGANHISGTGLGIAICRAIVTAHGGSLGVQSRVGVGTTVTARLRADLTRPQPVEQGGEAPKECAIITTELQN